MTRSALKPVRTKNEERDWWVGRCPKCDNPRMAVEVGDGDSYSRGAMESFGYVVKQEPGPIEFRPHAKECEG